MKVLLTGAGSFTGMWFAQALAAAGHDLTLSFRRKLDDYQGLRRARVERVMPLGRCVFGRSFGDEAFLADIAEQTRWDVLAHHAAEVGNYKSSDFDIAAALAANTRNLRAVLAAMAQRSCRRVVLTGSVFEPNEGAGSDGLRAFSAYGLSKALTAQVVEHHARDLGLAFDKFVIANPFGPFEEPRFTAYLVRNWYEGKTPAVNTPDYVRDNIHVTLLAKTYARFVSQASPEARHRHYRPSGYIESQGAFAQRFAAEMRPRLGLACPLELRTQTDFAEPRIRVNTDPVDAAELNWSATAAWDELADYYQRVHEPQTAARA